MNIEETKKIIQNKIQADEAARQVRSQIKTYIHEKQNVREGFTETFKPLIETSEKVKESIDTQQNKLIKQLQENQLALTEGLDKNRLAITSGFDKMDEVKKRDLEQLPGYEAIEEPEKEDEDSKIKEYENEKFKMLNRDLYFITGKEEYNKEGTTEIKRKDLLELWKEFAFLIKDEYEIAYDGDPEFKTLTIVKKREKTRETQEKGKPKERIIKFGDTDFDSGLDNAASVKFLEENDLPLPSRIQKESYETMKRIQRKSEKLLNQYKDILSNKAEFKIRKGVNKATPLNRNPRTETLQQIRYYNIIGEYVNNMNKLENIAKKTGQGIIHFNTLNN